MSLDGLRRMEAVLVEYAGDLYLHERRILGFDGADHVIVCTPHFDIYRERWSSYERMFLPGARGGLPARWKVAPRSTRVVRFRPGAWEAKRDELAAKWRRDLPSPRHGSLEAAKRMGPLGGNGADGPDEDADAEKVTPRGDATQTWVAIESRCG